jgi:peptidoglycan/LPS O-acetylase OafA/YrhL
MSQAAATQHIQAPNAVGDPPILSYAAPLPTHGSPGRVEMIDAVRGLACLWVLMHHSYLYWVWRIRLPVLWHLGDAARLGFLGVHLFLVISGFVLFFPVVRRHGIRNVRVDARSFFHRRARRILPPYYAAFIFFALLTLWPPYHLSGSIFNVRSVLEHLAMVYNLDPWNITNFNGAFWSLALEFQLYLTFPLLLWCCRRFGLWPTLGAALVLSFAWQTLLVPHVIVLNHRPLHSQQWPTQTVWYDAVPGRWFEFVAGAAAAALVVNPRRSQLAVALGLIVVCAPIAVSLNIQEGGWFGPFRDQLWGVTFASLLVLTAATPIRIARSAVVRLIAWTGGISYSIYLTHEPILHLSQPVLARLHVPLGARLPLFLFCGLPLLVAIGFGFHLLFERPFMSAKRPPLSPDAPVTARAEPSPVEPAASALA